MNEIERKFAEALCQECNVSSLEDMLEEEQHCLSECTPQYPIGIYIVDFYMKDCESNEFVVEIDGHDSHKSKLQRYDDYVRERFLQRKLITVIRFTASEVFVDAGKCARECLEIIDERAIATSGIQIRSYEIGLRVAKSEDRNEKPYGALEAMA
jgi:very-short-patch-repair endonuclease